MLTWLFYNDFFTIRIKAFYMENRHLINASRPGGVCLSGEVWLGGLIFFKDLRDCGLYLEDNVIEAECLKFCFMPVIREELHKFAIQWNLHKIRPSRNAESPSGRPDLLYHVPDLTGARDLMMPVSHEEVDIAEQLCGVRSPEHGCSEEFVELASLIMQEKGHTMPISPDNALVLFCTLIDDIADI